MSTSEETGDPEARSAGEAYRLLFDQAGEMVSILDLEGRITSVNPAAERLTGYPATELVGRLAIELVEPSLREQVARRFQERLLGDSSPLETVLVTREGKHVPVLTTSVLIVRDGRPAGVLGLITNLAPIRGALSEKAEAESNFRHAEARFRNFFASAPIGEAIVSPDGRFLEVNEALCAITGYSGPELCGLSFQEITHPDDLAPDLGLVQQLISGEIRTYQMEKRYLHKRGQIVWVLLSVSLVQSDSGEPEYFISQIQDITERRRSRDAIDRSEARLAEAQHVARIGSWEWEVATGAVTWSAELYELFEVDAGTPMTYTRYLDRVHPDDLSLVESTVENAGRTGESYELEHRVELTGGDVRWIHGRGQVTLGPDGPVAMRGTAQDITDQKDAEAERDRLREALYDAQKLEALGRFTGGVAHDFNNMLTAIKGYSELLLAELQPGTRQHHEAEQIRRAADQASSLPEQLLAFARKQPLEAKVVDLNDLVTAAATLLRHLVEERVELIVIPAPHPAFAKIDPEQIEQTLVNLALNARDAMPAGGSLTITVSTTANPGKAILDSDQGATVRSETAGSYAVIAVADDGEGMDAETRERAFEPFFTTKPQGVGSGLGLASVHGTVVQSGGSIRLESEPGQGTTVLLSFPSVTPDAVAASVTESRIRPVVLLVEDENLVRELVSSVLSRNGFDVHEVGNGVEALELLDRLDSPPDLLITDLVMPKMGGLELADRVAERLPRVKTVFISGYSDDKPAAEERARPGSVFVSKPFSPITLLRAVNELMTVDTSTGPGARHGFRPDRVTCVIADDHPAVLDSISRYLEGAGVGVVARVSRADDAVREIEALRPMTALVDITMEPFTGIEVARQAAVSSPQTGIVMYTGHQDEALLREALDVGARGFVLKQTPLSELLTALTTVAAGGTYVDALLAGALATAATSAPLVALTKRERQILTLLSGGMTNEKAAAELGISAETIQSHVRNAMTKLDADTRTQAVATAIRQALIV